MAVDIAGTKKLAIQYVDPKTLCPHPDAESIPMLDEDEKMLRESIALEGVKHPLDISSQGNILDGVHRQRYAIELDIVSIPAIVYHYEEPEEESNHAINANLKRRQLNDGQKAMLALKTLENEKKLATKRMSEKGKQGAQEAASSRGRDESGKFLSMPGVVPIGTTPGIAPEKAESNAKSPNKTSKKSSTSKKSEDNGKAADKAAKKVGVSARTIYRAQAVSEASPELAQAVIQGEVSVNRAYQQVKAEEKKQEVKKAIDSGRQLTDLEIMQKLDISVQPYDVWNFPSCDERFGHEYPGRIPGQLIAHCLYFWTRQGDLILDPMAGSGTTIDVCKVLNRRVLAYDAHPCREDITLHDLSAQGWPAETAEAQLIFWDPPYFKKKDDGYGEQSISRYNRKDYLAFFDQMARTIPDGFHGRLAFLMSDYTEEECLDESIWFSDYMNIFRSNGWHIERYIQTPLTTQSVHADIVKKFRETRRLARLGRVLAVMSR